MSFFDNSRESTDWSIKDAQASITPDNWYTCLGQDLAR